MGGNPSRPLFALMFSALAIAARLPFLVTGKIPFDSDEAVEGLMARHVLSGELPAFFWGQAFKGVPEVYASAGAFALFGSSVAILKGVTLVFFAVFVALHFILLDRIASRWIAVSASFLLIAAPPALVFWSLDASAEYILIMLLGTTLLLIWTGKRSCFAMGLVIGLGLWIHQLFIVYLMPLAITSATRREMWKRPRFVSMNRVALVLGAIAGAYFVLGVLSFFTGGFALRLGSLSITATAPQKMARIAIGVLALAAVAQVLSTATRMQTRDALRRYWPAGVGFFIGYSPVLLYSVLVEPARSPARVANFQQLLGAGPDILTNIVPILAGFKIATTERLPLPVIAAVPVAMALLAFLWSSRGRLLTDFFALFVIFYPLLFLASGAYLDTQSYRYFIPWYAGLAVGLAAGSLHLAQMVRLSPVARRIHASSDETRRKLSTGGKPDTTYFQVVAIGIVCAIAGVHVWQQAVWYHKLQPDMQSLDTIECLKRNGIRGGYAEYWTAYKLTFLAHESIIVAPTDGADRYPAYTEYVKSLPASERLDDAARCN